jgi:phosphomannomutase/phosphoglucomutase
MYYYGWDLLDVHAGVMVTASHNPKDDNGFKFSYNGIHNAYGDSVKEIYEIIKKGEFASGDGKIEDVDIDDAYIDLVLGKIKLGNRPIKVVYDCGNGTTSIIADKIFGGLNIEAIPLFNTSDGTFPNHHPDPCVYENLLLLRDKVLETHADFGIGFDGDGDRVGVIDNLGNMIETDKFMVVMWRYLYDKVEPKKGMYDIKCSKVVEDGLKKLGVEPVEVRTGASYTRAASASGNFPFGGELSGHLYFRDKFPGYDDGIYAGIRLIELLSELCLPLDLTLEGINKYYSTEELKIKVEDESKFKIIEKIKEYCLSKKYNILTIDGVKTKFDDGFALVRASNTGPNITMRFEATTEERLQEIQDEFVNELNRCIEQIKNN